jgi:hypothetical protein
LNIHFRCYETPRKQEKKYIKHKNIYYAIYTAAEATPAVVDFPGLPCVPMDTAAAEEKPWLDLPYLPGVQREFPDLSDEDMVRKLEALRGPVVYDEDHVRLVGRMQRLTSDSPVVEDERLHGPNVEHVAVVEDKDKWTTVRQRLRRLSRNAIRSSSKFNLFGTNVLSLLSNTFIVSIYIKTHNMFPA